MATIESKPVTPGQRFLARNQQSVAGNSPQRRLIKSKHRKKGRNVYGRITSRRRGGGHKRLYRQIDFRRDKFDIPARVQAIEYDPNRSANLALLAYADGEKRYILAPEGVKEGDTLLNLTKSNGDFNPGYTLPLSEIPPATAIHAIELTIGKGAQVARSAGQSATLVNVEKDRATIKMPSGEIRLVNAKCRATIGVVGNRSHINASMGKAGRNRWKGRRPRVRGVAMNPVDHPMGGGEGRTSGGGHPMSPWSKLSKGFPTRKKSKPSNAMILVRRNGRKMKR
ncbi:MAG: 50S ribosomal protein L2 [Opitutales bacterium]